MPRETKSSKLIEEVIEAHGGRDRWQAVERIEASLSSGGLAFASRLQPFALRNLRISMSPHARRVVLRDFCRKDWCGIWTPNHVQVRDENDSLVIERAEPRGQFNRLCKQFRWDKLDILYFAGYALWNYLSFPFILELPGVTLIEAEDENACVARRLVATFDRTVPTHSVAQSFHIDESRRLIRHDYTAELFSRWATAANCCLASEQVAGLRFYTRRKVYPRFGRHVVLPFPTLVWIEIDDIAVVYAEPARGGTAEAAAQTRSV